jgi:hypothetical protein
MKKFYSRCRIFLLTFAVGLACVPFFNDIYKRQTEIPVNLPQIQSEAPLYIIPKYQNEMPWGGSGCGFMENKIEKKVKKNRGK